MPTIEQIDEWKANYLTEEFLKTLSEFRKNLAEAIVTGQCFTGNLPCEIVYARETGKIELLDSILQKYSIWSDSINAED